MKNREHLSLHTTRTALLVIFISLAIIYIPTLTTAARPTSPGMNAPNAQTSPTCYKPLSVTSDISGYAEGYISVKNPYMQGQEIVYDLATFQRRQFGDKMSVGHAPQNTGKYVETISGFITNQGDPTSYTQFRAQYETFTTQNPIVNNSLPADAPIWSAWTSLPGRVGTVHFERPYNPSYTPNPISGDQAFLELDPGVTFTTGVSGQIGYFSGISSPSKSYIVNCLVDVNTLVNDINSGDGSPVTFSVSVSAWRNAAANAAQAAATDYNNRVLAGSGTPSPSSTPTFIPPTVVSPTATNTPTSHNGHP